MALLKFWNYMTVPGCLIHASLCNGWIWFTETHLSNGCPFTLSNWLLVHQTSCAWHTFQWITRNLLATPRCPDIWEALLLGRTWALHGAHDSNCSSHRHCFHLSLLSDFSQSFKMNVWVISTEAMSLKGHHVCMCVFIWVFIYLVCTMFGLCRDVAVPWSNAQVLRLGSRVPKSKPLPTLNLSSHLCPFTLNLFTLSSFFYWALDSRVSKTRQLLI